MLLKFKYKDATPEERQDMLTDIISLYNISDRSQLVMALAHCQTVYECSQEEFSQNELIDVTDRSIRNFKKDYAELYTEVFDKYKQEPEIKDVEVIVEEDIMENVYSNLLSKLSNPKTAVKDISSILTYFNISGSELRQYASLRGSSLRGFVRDNEKQLLKDEDTASLVKATLAESEYLYFGSERTKGNSTNYMEMDLDNPLVRLELQTAGMLMYGLWNGVINPQFVEMAETLRVLKMASGEKLDTKQAVQTFETMDGKPKKLKPFKGTEKEFVEMFGQEQGREYFQWLSTAKTEVDKKTAVSLPLYEAVRKDYDKHLRVFPSLSEMPLELVMAQINDEADKSYVDRYKQFTNTKQEEI